MGLSAHRLWPSGCSRLAPVSSDVRPGAIDDAMPKGRPPPASCAFRIRVRRVRTSRTRSAPPRHAGPGGLTGPGSGRGRSPVGRPCGGAWFSRPFPGRPTLRRVRPSQTTLRHARPHAGAVLGRRSGAPRWPPRRRKAPTQSGRGSLFPATSSRCGSAGGGFRPTSACRSHGRQAGGGSTGRHTRLPRPWSCTT